MNKMNKTKEIETFLKYLIIGNIILSIGTLFFYFTTTNILSLAMGILMITATLISILIKRYYSKMIKDD